MAKAYTRKCKPLAERFWAKVNRDGPMPSPEAVAAHPEISGLCCWIWTAGRSKDGYGHIREGRAGSRKRRASQVSWELTHGAILDGLDVLHKCDVRPCVRPEHLFTGTPAENSMDMVIKGRQFTPCGERHGQSKLTAAQVLSIRERHAAGEMQKTLAHEFGVCIAQINNIVHKRQWIVISHDGGK